MLAKKTNPAQPNYKKKNMWAFICEWVGEPTWLTTGSIRVNQVFGGPSKKLTHTEIC